MNSYEVSYLLKHFKPKWNMDISNEELQEKVSAERGAALLRWANSHISYEWLKEKAGFKQSALL